MPTWNSLAPDAEMVAALDSAGEYPFYGAQDAKKNWSKRLADASAQMIADGMRQESRFRDTDVYPNPDGSNREFTIRPRGGRPKSVDVVATTRAGGMHLALTLKGFNFPRYSHNFTGRLYELNEEVPTLHEHFPLVPVVGIFFLPLPACHENETRSSFSFLVEKLRPRTGRDDPHNVSQFKRLDWAAIALYTPQELDDGTRRGVCRYFPVMNAPPKIGRPQLRLTLSSRELAVRLAALMEGAGPEIEYSEPEST